MLGLFPVLTACSSDDQNGNADGASLAGGAGSGGHAGGAGSAGHAGGAAGAAGGAAGSAIDAAAGSTTDANVGGNAIDAAVTLNNDVGTAEPDAGVDAPGAAGALIFWNGDGVTGGDASDCCGPVRTTVTMDQVHGGTHALKMDFLTDATFYTQGGWSIPTPLNISASEYVTLVAWIKVTGTSPNNLNVNVGSDNGHASGVINTGGSAGDNNIVVPFDDGAWHEVRFPLKNLSCAIDGDPVDGGPITQPYGPDCQNGFDSRAVSSIQFSHFNGDGPDMFTLYVDDIEFDIH